MPLLSAQTVFLAAVLLSAVCFPSSVDSFDPSPVKDFDVPGKTVEETVASDFMSTLLRGEPKIPPGLGGAAQGLSVTQFPGLNTQGISGAKFHLLPCGMNPPHIHPRGTELIYVLKGKLYVAFIDTTNKIFANVLYPGDTTVLPRGLIHMVVNIGKEPALGLAIFNGQAPSVTRVGPALFKSVDAQNMTLPSALLASAFGVTPETVDSIKYTVQEPFPLGSPLTGCEGNFKIM